MSAVIAIGAQWGDEGKGKIVDSLAERAEVVVRYAGGPNAGHTLIVDGERFVLRLVPSGILRADCRCVMAQGMVIDPQVLVHEIKELETRGRTIRDRLFLSDRAHLVMPYHVLVDGLRESGAAPGTAIGTTRRGIGPCYEDKVGRRGVLTGSLRDPDETRFRVGQAIESWEPFLVSKGARIPTMDEVMEWLRPLAAELIPLLTDTSSMVHDELDAHRRVLFEGAQGTLLDIDHGTYPYVTSSSSIAGGVCTGVGVGPKAIDAVVGVAKAYLTRVGEGPFPTELDSEGSRYLQDRGGEFGSVTGRARRAGWLDLPALRYAVRVNGITSLALTKLDVLSGMDMVKICTEYQTPDGLTDRFPQAWLSRPGAIQPVWKEMKGWGKIPQRLDRIEELPDAALDFVREIERRCGVRCDIVSLGAAREALATVRDVFELR